MKGTASARAALRQLMREVEEAARDRFGEHLQFRVYCDVSDGVETDWDAALHYVRRPPNAPDDLLFPRPVVTAPTREGALAALLQKIRKEVPE